MDRTFRVFDLADDHNLGLTAATPELAKLAKGVLTRGENSRLAMEQTDWTEENGKLKPRRSVIIDAEDPSDPWKIGL